MTQVGVELNGETEKYCGNRRGWVSDRVKGCIAQRRSANKNYRCMRKICGVDDERTKRVRKKKKVKKLEGLNMYIMKW